MDYEEVVMKAKQYSEVVREHLNPKMVVLFGSYAKGNAHKDSDIDIAIVVDNLNDDFLEKYNQLFKLRRGIDSRIEPVLIDADDDQSGFYEEVINSGRVIYES